MDYIVLDIVVHYSSNLLSIEKVDPYMYFFLDLMNEIYEIALSHIPSQVGLDITFKYLVHGSDDMMVIAGDDDIMKMFKLHRIHRNIHLYVYVEGDTCGEGNTIRDLMRLLPYQLIL